MWLSRTSPGTLASPPNYHNVLFALISGCQAEPTAQGQTAGEDPKVKLLLGSWRLLRLDPSLGLGPPLRLPGVPPLSP